MAVQQGFLSVVFSCFREGGNLADESVNLG